VGTCQGIHSPAKTGRNQNLPANTRCRAETTTASSRTTGSLLRTANRYPMEGASPGIRGTGRVCLCGYYLEKSDPGSSRPYSRIRSKPGSRYTRFAGRYGALCWRGYGLLLYDLGTGKFWGQTVNFCLTKKNSGFIIIQRNEAYTTSFFRPGYLIV
jgi:hypothetical protein